MKHEWKPGDLAVVTTRSGATYRAAYRFAPGLDYFWDPLPGQEAPNPLADPDSSARPVVVIDPEDTEAVGRLVDLVLAHGYRYDHAHRPDLRAALRSFANPTPPKPEEPTGLGAVVEDAEGTRYVRTGYARAPWHNEDEDTIHTWAMFDAARVISPGVQ